MSMPAAANVTIAIVLILRGLAIWRISAANRRDNAALRDLMTFSKPAPVDDGPDTLRLLEELDDDLEDYAAAIAPYYESGLVRLRNAIDEPQGDQ